ncbi:MAG: DMT family transporter [Flavobacteriales bacterium]
MSKRTTSFWLLNIVVLVWGLTGILGKEISLSAVPLVFWRVFIAAAFLFIWMLIGKVPLHVERRTLIRYVLAGGFTAAHWLCFFGSIKASNVSVALAVLSTSAFFVSIVSPVLRREPFRWYEMGLGVVVFAGVAMIFNASFHYILGISLSLLAAFFASVFSTMNSKLVERDHPVRIAFWEMTSALVIVGIACLLIPHHGSFLPSQRDALLLLVLGILCTGLAFVVGIYVMKQLSPFTCAVAINMEPVYTIAAAVFLYGESEWMTLGFYIGAAVIMSTIFVDAWLKRRINAKTEAS